MKKKKSSIATEKDSAEARKATHDTPPSDSASAAPKGVQIVGIGASAGGLEAIEQFLSNVPVESGLAFVIIQHMDPTQKGLLVELLQNRVTLPVLQIRDRMKVQANHVYVIPPNKDVSILHGVLHLLTPEAPRGMRLPIDFFFRSLAADQKYRSMGVILSGMGSDGTLGLRSIKEQAGASFAQDPSTAKFDGMPRAAIVAGMVDIIAPAGELPGRMIDYIKRPPFPARPLHEISQGDHTALEKIFMIIRAQSGHDFALYKKSTMHRRIERRMRLHQISAISDYVTFLRQNAQEVELLFKELLIGVTNFFRDQSLWRTLKEKILPDYLASRSQGAALRAWTAGCSTGEEAYSLAIIFREVVEEMKVGKNFTLQIFATDLDKDAIDKARTGVFPPNISVDVSEDRLKRFFVENAHGNFVVKQEIREMITFAPQNLIMHPPITRLDFLTCRNLLIYLDAPLQKKVMPLFHYSLNPGGILVLGSAETIGSSTDLFSTLSDKLRIYQRLDTSPQMLRIQFPSVFTSTRQGKAPEVAQQQNTQAVAPTLQSLADQVLLSAYCPAAVLVTKEGDILYVNGKTGKYLEPAAGKANWNLFAMSREGLGDALGEAFHRAVRQKVNVTLKDIAVGTNGGTQIVDISIRPLTEPEMLNGMVLVAFSDVGPLSDEGSISFKRASHHKGRLSRMAQELQKAHQELLVARSDMQTSQEELKSTNEELQSMNEELQSTNEELTTSKEEMQSMNEELQTVNHELQAKVDELSRTSNDMRNLLNSTDIATLFLDESLLVRSFTIQTTKIIKLIQSDIGRPITDIVTTLDYPDLADDTREVLRTLAYTEKQVTAHPDRWFNVRIMPYRTQENRIDGVVVTFTDITAYKNLEAALRKAQAELQDELGKAHKRLARKSRLASRQSPDA